MTFFEREREREN